MFDKFIEKFLQKITFAALDDPINPPKKLHGSIKEFLPDNESILCTVRNYRAIHNAKNWKDRNTFFNSWCILTDRRLLIIRNLDYVKVFREIHLPRIEDFRIEKSLDNLIIKIITSGIEDTVEFSRYLLDHAERFSIKFSDAVIRFREVQLFNSSGLVKLECPKCAKMVFENDKFCSHCGSSLA